MRRQHIATQRNTPLHLLQLHLVFFVPLLAIDADACKSAAAVLQTVAMPWSTLDCRIHRWRLRGFPAGHVWPFQVFSPACCFPRRHESGASNVTSKPQEGSRNEYILSSFLP